MSSIRSRQFDRSRPELYVPERARLYADRLPRIATADYLARVVFVLTGAEHDVFPTVRPRSVRYGRRELTLTSVCRRGENYRTCSMAIDSGTRLARFFSRQRIIEDEAGLHYESVPPVLDADRLRWRKGANHWDLIEKDSRLAEQTELPVARVVGAEPDTVLPWAIRLCEQVTAQAE